MTVNDFLNQDSENFDSISSYYFNYLKQLSEKDYPFVEYINLKGFSHKYLLSVRRNHYLTEEKRSEFNEKIDRLLRDIQFYSKSKKISSFLKIFLPVEPKLFTVNRSFELVYADAIDLMNNVIESRQYLNPNLSINDFYEPKNTNKEKVIELIKDAIELIDSDDSLTESTKKQINDYLKSVLKNIDREFVNWSEILGKIKETILVLGALGSFIGGITPLIKAKEKLEETDTIIQKTSINYNYKTINNTFQIKNIEQFKQIENQSTIFLIEEPKENE